MNVMVKVPLRTKSISTKVTEEEYAALEAVVAASGGVNMSEWVRGVLLDQVTRRPREAGEETTLAEILGLRTILLNLFFGVARGESMTSDEMDTVIRQADQEKVNRARKLLTLPAAQEERTESNGR